MIIKVCGITNAEQAATISTFVDYIGFIFHPQSKRYTANAFATVAAKKTGVFVNASIKQVIRVSILEKLEAVQLHGDESPEFCSALQHQIPVIKSFGIYGDFDFEQLKAYESTVDYFLFDTKTSAYGGSGITFNWDLLDRYQGSVPFLLSGGIRPELLKKIKRISHPQLAGIDLNSGFEIEAGIKNIELLKQFIDEFKS